MLTQERLPNCVQIEVTKRVADPYCLNKDMDPNMLDRDKIFVCLSRTKTPFRGKGSVSKLFCVMNPDRALIGVRINMVVNTMEEICGKEPGLRIRILLIRIRIQSC